MDTKRICLWSSPRNISTAMMYFFAQRPDTIVFDEVFITGTMGELTPVYEIDGRVIENKSASAIRNTLYATFKKLTATEGEPV